MPPAGGERAGRLILSGTGDQIITAGSAPLPASHLTDADGVLAC